jgi:hypothetical protein
MTSSSAAASRTVRLRGPSTARPLQSDPAGPTLTRPRLGLNPKIPHELAGMRIEPPPSLPWATGTRPADTAAAAPPLEPPALRVRSHGVRAGPTTSLSVYDDSPNSGVLVLPRLMNPASRISATR